MGVPKFYRWISERYPCLSEVVKESSIPEFDQLYLDMNGIIHNCSHPNDDDPHFRLSEEAIFENIFSYVEVIFRLIRPKKVFFMAVDGVAPRAKMNQQRGRRFRTARDAAQKVKKALEKGETLPSEAAFDSNCITPGTQFMADLQAQLEYFVASKISTDPLWRDVRVILSGHNLPGEGEHKIMDFIRFEKSKEGYDPNTRHCLYGLDADLIMLGLCTHDPHFSLLREEVKFGGRNKSQSSKIVAASKVNFHLLHLSLLREYIDLEFSMDNYAARLPFKYDLESIIDDWILMGFLVGNDFLPHLPHLHINKNALSELYLIYKEVLPKLGGYINENGILNLKRFEVFMGALGEMELARFDEIYSDMKWIEGKTARKNKKGHHTVLPTPGPGNVSYLLDGKDEGAPDIDVEGRPMDSDLKQLLDSTKSFLQDDSESASSSSNGDLKDDFEEEDGRDHLYRIEFRQYKREYYTNKMRLASVNRESMNSIARDYVKAIQWILHYYFHGCISWSWYFNHHYAPWITDIRNFADMKHNFNTQSRPFRQFEQLLAVLPPQSGKLLPEILRNLMTSSNSPILDFYPMDFECDLNGKHQDWESVVLLPFIDEKRLVGAIESLSSYLQPKDVQLNTQGPMKSYVFTPQSVGSLRAPNYFPTIDFCYATVTDIKREEWHVPLERLNLGLMKGAKLSVYFPGFPTLQHIAHSARISSISVRVFESPSIENSCVLTLTKPSGERPHINSICEEYLGKKIWVTWPHMKEAVVVAVADAQNRIELKNRGDKKAEMVSKSSMSNKEFSSTVTNIAQKYKSRFGIEIGETRFIIYASLVTGRKYMYGPHGKVTLTKTWDLNPQPFALQTTKKDIDVHSSSIHYYHTLKDIFPENSYCFVLSDVAYGCMATVLGEQKGKIEVQCDVPKEPNFTNIVQKNQADRRSYVTGYSAARKLNISNLFLSRIMGSMYILQGDRSEALHRVNKMNVGLNLKFSKRNEETVGYTRKDMDNNTWYYSEAALQLLNEYIEKFPEIVDFLVSSDRSSDDLFYVQDLFPEAQVNFSCPRLLELKTWLSLIPCANLPRRSCGSETLDESSVLELEKLVEAQKSDCKKILKLQIHPKLLYKSSIELGMSEPDPKNCHYQLFNRVINVREGFSVPLGARGTIIGVIRQNKTNSYSYEVLFDQAFRGGVSLRSSPGRGFVLPSYAMIKLTPGGSGGKQQPREAGEGAEGRKREEKSFSWNNHNNNNNRRPREDPYVPRNSDNHEESRPFPMLSNKDQGRPQYNKKPTMNSNHHSNGNNKGAPMCIPPDPTNLPPNPGALFKSKKGSPGKNNPKQNNNNNKKNEDKSTSVNNGHSMKKIDSKPDAKEEKDPLPPSVRSFFQSVDELSLKDKQPEVVKEQHQQQPAGFVPLQVHMKQVKRSLSHQKSVSPTPQNQQQQQQIHLKKEESNGNGLKGKSNDPFGLDTPTDTKKTESKRKPRLGIKFDFKN